MHYDTEKMPVEIPKLSIAVMANKVAKIWFRVLLGKTSDFDVSFALGGCSFSYSTKQ